VQATAWSRSGTAVLHEVGGGVAARADLADPRFRGMSAGEVYEEMEGDNTKPPARAR
jgi:hypothetical protein